jgi:putative peptidoglycan lipid II flippase
MRPAERISGQPADASPMRLFRSFATVSGFVVLSRVLGFTRDILIAKYLGAGPVADAFVVAFRFPNMFRNLFAEGAFNVSFVPVFSSILEQRGRPQAQLFAEQVLAGLLCVLILFLFAVELAMPWFISLVAPGFTDDGTTFDLAIRYTRLTLPYLLFAALGAMLSGLLNSLYRFAAAAAAPLMVNVVMIAVLLVAWRSAEVTGYYLSWGITTGGVFQFLILIWACHAAGVDLRLPRPTLSPDVRHMLRLMLPAAIGAGAAQINLLVGTALASLVGTGAIAHLYYAERVNWLPVGIVGVAMGTALLPRISRLLGSGQNVAAMHAQNRALELSLLLGLPAMAALMVIRLPIVSVLFVRGAFTEADAVSAAAALAAFSIGLPGYLIVRVAAPAFYARHNTTTPVKVAFVAVAVNVVASLSLMWSFGIVGIATANALAGWTNAGLLIFLLHRRGLLVFDERLRKRAPRIAFASLVMALALLFAAPYLAPYLAGTLWTKLLALFALVAGGAIVYAVVVLVTRAATIADIKNALSRG